MCYKNIESYSSIRDDYDVQSLPPTITLKFYLMSFHFIQKENLIQENKALYSSSKLLLYEFKLFSVQYII